MSLHQKMGLAGDTKMEVLLPPSTTFHLGYPVTNLYIFQDIFSFVLTIRFNDNFPCCIRICHYRSATSNLLKFHSQWWCFILHQPQHQWRWEAQPRPLNHNAQWEFPFALLSPKTKLVSLIGLAHLSSFVYLLGGLGLDYCQLLHF